jgi:hypothetical protein
MPVLGIQNFDRMMKHVEMMEKACGEKTRDEALAAAGDVLADALVAATPTGSQAHKSKGGRRPPGNARQSVINVPARSKAYGVSRRLIGYSKQAYYMLWVQKGHRIVVGGRLSRKAHKNALGGRTHSQGGKGGDRGFVSGRHFMERVFKANIKRAMETAKEVIRRAARG